MLYRQCIVVFFLGFLIDLTQTVHIQACSDRKTFLAVTTVIGIYLLGFLSHDWFVKSESMRARWWITVAGGVGAGLGTWTVLSWE